MRLMRLADGVLGFYDGRSPVAASAPIDNWVDDGALSLGICSYAVVDGVDAIVYGIREPRRDPRRSSKPFPDSKALGFLNRRSQVRVVPGEHHGFRDPAATALAMRDRGTAQIPAQLPCAFARPRDALPAALCRGRTGPLAPPRQRASGNHVVRRQMMASKPTKSASGSGSVLGGDRGAHR